MINNSDIYLFIFGILFAIYLCVKGHGSPRNVDFIVSAFIAGYFSLSQIFPLFDPSMKLFGVIASVVVAMGALVGGVVGILLPKVSSGFSLGVCMALILSMIIYGENNFLSVFTEIFGSSFIFICCITLAVVLTQKYDSICATLRTCFVASFSFTLGIDRILSHGLSNAVFDVLRMDPSIEHYCFVKCNVPLLIGVWIVGAILLFLLQGYLTGSFNKWFNRNRNFYQPLNSKGDSKGAVASQRTFSYPDTLEFNFFDPDNVPEMMRPYADVTFTTVQKLAFAFGFQVDNSRNQAEHLLMMLTNETRAGESSLAAPASRLHDKLFTNYKKWCDRIGAPPVFCIREVGKAHAAVIEDMLVFLLIWGEAANIRHIPECLCWLYHKTMSENLSFGPRMHRESLYPGFYLDMVITPIYEVIAASIKSKGDHVQKKIYDDFNEFFWSPTCLHHLHREISLDSAESGGSAAGVSSQPSRPSSSGIPISRALAGATKTYLERRSWFHPLFSFRRVMEWHVVSFYLIATIAFGNQLVWNISFSLQVGSFVFWMITFMALLWTCLEVWTVFPSSSMSGPSLCGYFLRLLFGYVVLVYQTIYYHWSYRTDIADPGTLRAQGDANFWWWQFNWLSLVALSLYFLESLFCWVPAIVASLMCWNNDMVQAVLNICYPFSQLYVGKKILTPQSDVVFYILFWLTLIAFKFWFGYFYVIFPVTIPTLELYDDYMNFQHVSFIKTAFLMFVWWFPHFLVYLIDLSIWYTVWAAGVGGFIALVERQGAVRDPETLRSHFMRMPYAFCQKLMPSTTVVGMHDPFNRKASSVSVTGLPELPSIIKDNNKKASPSSAHAVHQKKFMSTADLEKYHPPEESGSTKRMSLNEIINIRTLRWVAFSKAWNIIIDRLRSTDHLSDAERDILTFSSFDWLSKPVYLPLFQTAGCFETAMHNYKAAAEDYLKEPEPVKKIIVYEKFKVSIDVTSLEAVNETWELSSWTVLRLVGSIHAQDLTQLLVVLNKWASSEEIFHKMSLDVLPTVSNHIGNIVSALKGGIPKRKKNPVVTAEVMKSQEVEKNQGSAFSKPESGGGAKPAMKKSVSTGFLAALGDSHNDTTPEKGGTANAGTPKYAKLQPFRKSVLLADTLRDKVREELRSLLNCIRGALRAKSGTMSVEGQDLVDRITFVMSMESGFLWNDVYASTQLDELAKDSRVPSVLNKLTGLLKLRQTEVEPSSPEARRRLSFFVNSLFMDMPSTPPSRYSKDYTCMTPFYSEDVLLTRADLEAKNSDGVTTILYLQTLYKKDWINFLERRGLVDDLSIWNSKNLQETRMWASLRAQTLFRTVEGMMYTDAAIRLMAELENISNPEIETLTKLKFSYVVACQVYGQMKKNLDHKSDDIEFLLSRHPNLRVAYMDSVRVNRDGDLNFYSVLIKGDYVATGTAPKAEKSFRIKEVYRVKLPGNPVLGEGKPENQNHAVIFTRGRYLQAVDMNQDGYFEEALKMRNLLEEFNSGCTILGFREHIFTGSVSSVANYMALQELSFVTLGQRVLYNPLRIRQHYGHPDLFDKMFVMTEGGVSKASPGINLSEDVFAGFNATIRGHKVAFKEYCQVGKGRDVGLQQTYKFEAKLSQGNAEQSLSRDVSRINDRLDFFRLMSFYYGGIGHYMANTMVIFTLKVVVYCMVGQAIYNEETVNGRPMTPEGLLQLALAGLGILQTMPLAVTLTVEKGVFRALSELSYMIVSGGPMYFIFHIQTKCYYYAQTLLAGGAMYRPTGRGFVIRHSPFDENYRFFAFSHIYLGFELMAALVILALYTTSKQYPGLTWALWLAGISFVFSPFWFNPLSFEINKVSEDYVVWMRWMMEVGGTSEQSWVIWWREEAAFLPSLSLSWKAVLLATRCFPWVFVGYGLSGHKILTDSDEQQRVLKIIALFVFFVGGHWITSQLERSCSYAIRRVCSFLVSALVASVAIYLYLQSYQYIVLTLTLYYFTSALSLILLLSGVKAIAYVYKIHDYIVGHFIFLVLIVLSVLQVGYVQTWLLYHNALSAGVVIEDILKHARKSKEKDAAETDVSIAELRAQLAEQDRTIKLLLEDREKEKIHTHGGTPATTNPGGASQKPVAVVEMDMAKKGLLAGTQNIRPYGAINEVNSNNTASKPIVSALKGSTSNSGTTSNRMNSSQGTSPSTPITPLVNNTRNTTSTSSSAINTKDTPFVFVQPSSFPVRESGSNTTNVDGNKK